VNAHSYGEKREEKRGKELHRGDSGNLVWCSTMTVALLLQSGQVWTNGIPGPEMLPSVVWTLNSFWRW
jgi:hypothetical protein